MAKCPTCRQEMPQSWTGCQPCVSGSHHCSTPGCECPVCPHPVDVAPAPLTTERDENVN